MWACETVRRPSVIASWQGRLMKPGPKPKPQTIDRLLARSHRDPQTGCWIWMGARDTPGYGRVFYGGRLRGAHEAAYEWTRGPIPDGLTIDHLCRNKPCINPEHLEVVTMRENGLRGNSICARHARQTHCKRGHEFTPENTYGCKTKYGTPGRICKTCFNMRRPRYKSKTAVSCLTARS